MLSKEPQTIIVTRHDSADSLLKLAGPLLMLAEAENNLIIGVVQGIARNPGAAANAYLASVGNAAGVLACAVHLPPFKVLITRANREPIVALAEDVFKAVPDVEGVTGPARSATDFAMAWSRLSGVEPELGMRLRIHEARLVTEPGLRTVKGHFRQATVADLETLTRWTDTLVTEARIPEKADSARVVGDAIQRGRIYVWDDGQPVSMAAWTGKTPSGVRINSVYTPRELRGNGYATACVRALTRQQLEQGSAFCWLYTDLSSAASPNIFKRIGYWPVSDVSEYYLRG
jgi:predicted GNAT family acetyltransferase